MPNAAEPRRTVYFYSPETNINNFSSLKAEFDAYLSEHGPYAFQPFSKRDDFEKFVADKKDSVLMVSSWHYRRLRGSLPIEAALVGMVKERASQRRILSAKKEGLDRLKGQKIASAGSEDFTRTTLAEMLGPDHRELVDSFKVLVVPKDIDALMAVSFGMAKAALTTEGSLGKLQRVNPKLHGMLQPLATSEEALLPVVAVPKGAAGEKDVSGILAAMAKMGDQEGGNRLKIIGLDGLRPLAAAEREILEQ